MGRSQIRIGSSRRIDGIAIPLNSSARWADVLDGQLPPRSPIRILFVADSIREPATGVGRVALTLMRELVSLGHEVTPVDWQHNELAARVAGRCDVIPPRLPWAKTALWHLELLRRLPEVPHDVVLNPSGYPNALGSHPKLVFWVHDLHMMDAGGYRPFKTSWFRLWYRRGLLNARLLVCPSEYTRTQLLRRFSPDPERCLVLPNSLDPSFVVPASSGQPERPYFLTVGTIENRKNVHRLAEAFAVSRASGNSVPLLVVGKPGHGSKMFMHRINEPDLRGLVEVRTDVDDAELRRLYQGATALIFPSLEEGFGLPILEAMEAGTPVLTSNGSALAEVAGDAALLVDPRDTDSIQRGICQLAADSSLREDLRKRGRERVRAFDAASQGRALQEQLATVAD